MIDPSTYKFKKYNRIKHFTLNYYKRSLIKTKLKYLFKGFEVLDKSFLDKRFALIRHHIDMSPGQALKIATIAKPNILFVIRKVYFNCFIVIN